MDNEFTGILMELKNRQVGSDWALTVILTPLEGS